MRTNFLPRITTLFMGAVMGLSVMGSHQASAQVSAYTFSQASGSYTPVSAAATLVDSAYYASTSNSLDTKGWTVSMPFSLSLNGTSYNSLYISSNGGLTFGTTTSTGTTLLSSSTGYEAAIAANNRDLWGIYSSGGVTTSGSPTITNVSSFYGLQVGSTLQGTGIPSNSTVISFDAVAGTITMSANATSSSSSASVRWGIGKVYTETIGTAPNRIFIVEWKDFSDYSTSANYNTRFSFQIRLEETSNKINIIYGDFTNASTTSRTCQVGLRGSSNTDYNNRTTTSDWSASTAGTANSSTMTRDNLIYPASGLTYTWTPPTCLAPSAAPTFSNFTAQTAEINWTAANPAPAVGYQYYYSSSNTTPGSGVTPSGSTNASTFTASLSGLNPMTTYYVWVRSDCGNGDYSNWSVSGSFTTLCQAFSTPFSESFSGGSLPQCWTNTTVGSTSANALWKFTGTQDYGTASNGRASGTIAFVDASSPYAGIHEVTLTSPQIDLNGLTTPYVQFDWFKNNEDLSYDNNKLTVQVNNGSGWTTIFSDTSNASIWRTVGLPLGAAYLNDTIQLRFVVDKDVAGNGYFYDNLLLDSVVVKDAPSCYTPNFPPTASNITVNTATLEWVASSVAPANGYEYYVSTSSSTPTSGATPSGSVGAGVLSANLPSLTGNTTYYAWVRAKCSSTSVSDWSAPTSFTTQHLVPAPWTEPFAATSTPTGWTTPSWSIGSVRGVTGNPGNNIYINIYSSNPSGTFTTTNVGPVSANHYFTVDYKASLYASPYNPVPSGSGYIKVYISTDYGATYAQLDSLPIPATTAWGSLSYPLAAYAGMNVKIQLEAVNTAEDYDVAFDNFFIGIPPSCLPPTALSAITAGANAIDLSWMAPTTTVSSGYQYYYSTSNTPPTAGTAASGSVAAGNTSTTINGLTPSTTYYIWMRSQCSATDSSAWSLTNATATTDCLPYSTPFTESFSGGALPGCWQSTSQNTGTYAFWRFSGASGYGTTGQGRPSGTYAWVDASSPYTGVHNVTLTTPLVDLTGLNMPTLEFDWYKSNSSTAYDNNQLTVQINNGSGWTTIFNDTSNASAWRTVTLPLGAAYVNDTVKLRFIVDKDLAGNGYFYDDLLLDEVKLIELPCSTTVNLGADTSICSGNTLTLDAGNAGSSYLWSNGATSQTINVTSGGSYSVTVTNSIGCTASDTIQVTVNSNPTVNLGNDTSICSNTNITLDAGSAGTTYLWSTGAGTQTITVATAGTYSVVVTNAANCSSTDTIVVGSNPVPSVDLGMDTTLCGVSSYTLDAGNAGADYLWSTTATTQTINVTSSGTYSVQVTNASGCSMTDTVVVTLATLPVVDLGPDTSICANSSLTLDAGNAGADYLWSTGDQTQSISLNSAGTYSVTVTNSDGCSTADTIALGIDPLPSAAGIDVTGTTPTFSFSGNTVQNANGYSWNFGDGSAPETTTTASHTYTANGNYTVTLILTNDCGNDTLSTTVTVTGLSVSDIEQAARYLHLFPNPAQQYLTVENKGSKAISTMQIYNVLGQKTMELTGDGTSRQRIDISNLANGMYTLSIHIGDLIIHKKFEIVR